MDTILVVNAGSSSVKFQVFAVENEGDLRRQIKGQMDGIEPVHGRKSSKSSQIRTLPE
jgi:acetate kinase